MGMSGDGEPGGDGERCVGGVLVGGAEVEM